MNPDDDETILENSGFKPDDGNASGSGTAGVRGRAKTGDASPLPAGTRLGDYAIEKLIGAGAMGDVYLARQVRLDQICAVKVLPEVLTKSADFEKRFEEEGRSLARLDHQNIVRVLNASVDRDKHFLAMEYVGGGSLEDYLAKRGGKIPPKEVRQALAEVLAGLVYAHGKNVVHRDLKPSNILRTEDGRYKISDFGLALVAGEEYMQSVVEESLRQSQLAVRGSAERSEDETLLEADLPSSRRPSRSSDAKSFVGTLLYMSPEVQEGIGADARSDIYAVGIMAYQILTGRKPARGRSKEPSKLVQGLSPKWDDWVFKCMEPEPKDRFQSAADAFKALPKVSNGSHRFKHFFLAASAIAAAVIIAAVYIHTHPSAAELIRRAGNGYSEAAMAMYTEVIGMAGASAEDRADAFIKRGEAKRGNRDNSGAIADFTEAIDMAGASSEQKIEALLDRADARDWSDDDAGALADYTTVIDIPGLPVEKKIQTLFMRGQLKRFELNDSAGGIADYTTIIGMAEASLEDKVKALLCRGEARGIHDVAGSTADYTTVINMAGVTAEQKIDALQHREEVKENDVLIWGRDVENRKANALGAIEDCTTLIDMLGAQHNDVAGYYYSRGRLKGDQGDFAGAVADYTACINRAGNENTFMGMGYAYYWRGDAKARLGWAGAVSDFTMVKQYKDTTSGEVLGKAEDAIKLIQSGAPYPTDTEATASPEPSETENAQEPAPASTSETGGIVVKSVPAGATVCIDDNDSKTVTTPDTIEGLAAGEHTLFVSMDGYEPTSATVTVEAGKFVSVPVLTLVRETGTLVIKSKPALLNWSFFKIPEDADPSEKSGETPAVVEKLPTGDYVVEFAQKGWAPVQKSVTIETGKALVIEQSFSGGAMKLECDTPGAAWRVVSGPAGDASSALRGTTPFTLNDIPPGDYVVEFTSNNLPTVTREVTVEVGKKAIVTIP